MVPGTGTGTGAGEAIGVRAGGAGFHVVPDCLMKQIGLSVTLPFVY